MRKDKDDLTMDQVIEMFFEKGFRLGQQPIDEQSQDDAKETTSQENSQMQESQ